MIDIVTIFAVSVALLLYLVGRCCVMLIFIEFRLSETEDNGMNVSYCSSECNALLLYLLVGRCCVMLIMNIPLAALLSFSLHDVVSIHSDHRFPK